MLNSHLPRAAIAFLKVTRGPAVRCSSETTAIKKRPEQLSDAPIARKLVTIAAPALRFTLARPWGLQRWPTDAIFAIILAITDLLVLLPIDSAQTHPTEESSWDAIQERGQPCGWLWWLRVGEESKAKQSKAINQIRCSSEHVGDRRAFDQLRPWTSYQKLRVQMQSHSMPHSFPRHVQ